MTRIGAVYLRNVGFGSYLRAGTEFIAAMWWWSGHKTTAGSVFLRISRQPANRAGEPKGICYSSPCEPVAVHSPQDLDQPLVFLYDELAPRASRPLLSEPVPTPLAAQPTWRRIADFNRSAPTLYRDIMAVECSLRYYLPSPAPQPSGRLMDLQEDDHVH